MVSNAAIEVPDITEHQLIESYLSAIAEAIDFVETRINPVLTKQISPTDSEAAVLGTFYRLHLVVKGIVALNDRQHFQLVVGAARTLFELLIDIHLLASDMTGNFAAQYTAYADVERFRVAQRLSRYPDESGATDSIKILGIEFAKGVAGDTARKSQVEEKLRRNWGVDKKGNPRFPDGHWSDMDLRRRCKALGSYYETFYVQLYSFASWYSHAGSAGYAGLDQDGLGRVFGMAADVSRIMYLDAICLVSKLFHLTKVWEDFAPIMEFLQNAPKELLTDKLLKERRERQSQK